MASKEDCRKFWLCKEEEEGSRVLEVIWVVVNFRVIMSRGGTYLTKINFSTF